MSNRAKEAALKAYPKDRKGVLYDLARKSIIQGYQLAEKDLAPAFEFSFDVPDNDGHIVFTPMDNMTIRKELKLKKG